MRLCESLAEQNIPALYNTKKLTKEHIQYTRDQLVDGNLTPTALAVVRVHNVFPSRLLELCRALAEDMRTIPTVAAVRGETKIKHGCDECGSHGTAPSMLHMMTSDACNQD